MNAIVYDLELVKRFKKGQLSEIVEIGACKVNIKDKKIMDTFQIYITPKSGHVGKSTRKFINMRKEDIKNAVPFRLGINEFKEWIGTEDYYLCSWGKDDKLHLINQCVRDHINLDWFKNYNDIQKQIGKIIDESNKNQLGLKNALLIAGIEPIGVAHRGIDDAINTAELFIKYVDQIVLLENSISKHELNRYKMKAKRSRFHHQEQKKVPPKTNHSQPLILNK